MYECACVVTLYSVHMYNLCKVPDICTCKIYTQDDYIVIEPGHRPAQVILLSRFYMPPAIDRIDGLSNKVRHQRRLR